MSWEWREGDGFGEVDGGGGGLGEAGGGLVRSMEMNVEVDLGKGGEMDGWVVEGWCVLCSMTSGDMVVAAFFLLLWIMWLAMR